MVKILSNAAAIKKGAVEYYRAKPKNKSKGVAIACTKFIENNLSAINKKAANIKEQIQQIHKI